MFLAVLLMRDQQDTKADVMIISEQYKDRNIPGWYSDILNTASIWIRDRTRVLVGSHGSCRGFVWIKRWEIGVVSYTPDESIYELEENWTD